MSLVNAETGELLAEMTPDEARSLTDRIKTALGVSWELIIDAYQRRAWAALGFPSWDAYTSAEFGGYRLRLPQEERQDVIASLREAGLSIRAIAAATGAGVRTVQRDLNAGVANGHTSTDLPPAVDPAASSAVDPAGEGQESQGEDPAPRPGSTVDEAKEAMDRMRAAMVAANRPDQKITGTDGKQYLDRSRAGMEARVEKAKTMAAEGYSSRQISSALGMSIESFGNFKGRHGVEVPADAITGTRTRRLDNDRIVSETVGALEGFVMSIELVGHPADAGLDPEQIEGWATSLHRSLTVLRQFSKQLKEMTQ